MLSRALPAVELGKTAESSVADMTRRLRAGEDEAFREFHARYFDRLYQFLLVLNRGCDVEAQDALQETLLRVSRYIRPFSDEEIFWSWLKMVARSAVRDRGRKYGRYFAALKRFAMHRIPAVASDEEVRLHESLSAALKDLDMPDRDLIEAKYFEKASIRELAAQLGQSERAIESRLLRLRRNLRESVIKQLRRL